MCAGTRPCSVGVHLDRQSDLPEVGRTLHAVALFTCAIQSRQEDRDQQGDDPNDNQQLDEGKAPLAMTLLHDEAPFDKAGQGTGRTGRSTDQM